ncbi:MAG: phage tail tape measure protein [Pseudomonadota bacterium]
MTKYDDLEELEDAFQDLGSSFSTTRAMAEGFSEELGQMQRGLAEAGAGTSKLSRGLTTSLRGAFEDVLIDGSKVSDVLRDVGQKMVRNAFRSAVTPVAEGVTSAVNTGASSLFASLLPFAKGGAFSQGRVTPFAKGGVVDSPVGFPMRGGAGLMGEAGPEAIMPLTRGPDGSLGVRSAGGARPVSVTFNIQTPDAEGFRRSQGQIAARMSRVLGQGQRFS